MKNKKLIITAGALALMLLTVRGAYGLWKSKPQKLNAEISQKAELPPEEKLENVPIGEKTFLEINGVRLEISIARPMSVYDFMEIFRQEGKINFTDKTYIGMGKFIDTINGIKGDGEKTWIYYVNGAKAEVGVSNYQIKPGDVVSWKYEKLLAY
jgi:hypothetical protein